MDRRYMLTDPIDKAAIQRRRRSFRLPFALQQVLAERLTVLSGARSSRAWGLPETDFNSEVEHYAKRLSDLEIDSPIPGLLRGISGEHAEEIALKIGAGLDFAALAERAEPMVRPILLYYSCAHLTGAFCRAYFNWKKDRSNHGVTCEHNSKQVQLTQVGIESKGNLMRAATAMFLFTAEPTPFTPLVTFSSTPSFRTEPGELLEKFGVCERGEPLKKVSLEELAEFNFAAHLRDVRLRHGFHKFRGLPSTAFLLDLILLFLASSMARYDVLGWKSVLEGKRNSYRIMFEEAYERYLVFGIDALLRGIENPQIGFGERIIRSVPSPYSHDDRARFPSDPNWS
jgi:hypothetical protein